MNAARLEALAIRVHFQGVKAIDGVDLAVEQGEILGLIGPNGAGKTTLVNVLTGFQRPTTGTVAVNRRDITTWGPAAIARAGLARTFQGARLFAGLTIFENVEVANDLSNARVEAINTQIRMITHRAFGFHSPGALIALAGLCPPLPW